MNLKAKVIDVIIPCWNVEEYIKPLLKSLDMQTLSETLFNIILIDNNSTDDTFKIITDYSKTRNNVKVAKQIIQGPGPARQKGFDMALSTWIIHLDSDGYISKKYLESFYNAISPKYDLIFSDNNLYLKSLNSKPTYLKRFLRSFYNGWFNLFKWPDTADPRSKMWRRELIKDLKWTLFKRGEDWVFFAQGLNKIRKNAFRRIIFNNIYFDFYGRVGSTNNLIKKDQEYLGDQIKSHYLASEIFFSTSNHHNISKRMGKKALKIAKKSEEVLKRNGVWKGLHNFK